MQRFLVSVSLGAAVLLTSVSSAFGGPPGTFELRENGRAPVHENARLAQQAGKDFAIRTVGVDPGGSLPVDNVVVLVKQGTLRAELNCTGAETWDAGHAYPSPGRAWIENQGQKPAELVVLAFNASSRDPAACAPGPSARTTELSRGVAVRDATIDLEAGKQVVVQSFVVEPGFNFFWHEHPGPSLIVEQQGTMREYLSCTETQLWEPGYAYFHTPGHHGHGKQTVKNEGDKAAVFMAVFFNVWEWHPAPFVPRDVQPPYTECPTASLTSR
jgi:quercetin dioxygenase-like cupin family protein